MQGRTSSGRRSCSPSCSTSTSCASSVSALRAARCSWSSSTCAMATSTASSGTTAWPPVLASGSGPLAPSRQAHPRPSVELRGDAKKQQRARAPVPPGARGGRVKGGASVPRTGWREWGAGAEVRTVACRECVSTCGAGGTQKPGCGGTAWRATTAVTGPPDTLLPLCAMAACAWTRLSV